MQVTKNCHFITRYLSNPWERADRFLRFFDFDEECFGSRSSRSLFAADSINTPDVESWLKRMVEDPLARTRPKLAAGDPAALSDWQLRRAAVLMLWLQGLRGKSVSEADARRELDSLAAAAERDIDGLVSLLERDYDLQVVSTVGDADRIAPLFLPSTGIFPFVLRDAACLSGFSLGLGMPLDLRCCLVATPKDDEGKLDLGRLPSSISNLSVGLAPARRVVIPPGLPSSGQTEDDLRSILLDQRRQNVKHFADIEESRRLVVEAFGISGLVPELDGAGRLRPPRP